MPSDQTPRQPGATPLGGTLPVQPEQGAQHGAQQHAAEHPVEFSEALIGESGDPIWESRPPQLEPGRAERARRAVREPEGKLPPGRIIELHTGGREWPTR